MGLDMKSRPDDGVLVGEYRALRESVGWSPVDSSDGAVQGALDTTWNVTARDSRGGLVALVRLLDDGLLYASIWDMMVAPAFQGRGIGGHLFQAVCDQTRSRQLVSLVATPAGQQMYRRTGFSQESRGSIPLVWRRNY
jgi:GNAT superfamily N-acetyltransferase